MHCPSFIDRPVNCPLINWTSPMEQTTKTVKPSRPTISLAQHSLTQPKLPIPNSQIRYEHMLLYVLSPLPILEALLSLSLSFSLKSLSPFSPPPRLDRFLLLLLCAASSRTTYPRCINRPPLSLKTLIIDLFFDRSCS